MPLPGLSIRFVQVHRNHRNRSLPGNRIRGATREQQAAPLHTDAPVCARLAGEARLVRGITSGRVAMRLYTSWLPKHGAAKRKAMVSSMPSRRVAPPARRGRVGLPWQTPTRPISGFEFSQSFDSPPSSLQILLACSPARLLAFSPRFLDVSPNLCHTRYTNAITWGPPMCATLSSYTCAACGRGMTGRHDPLPVGPVATVC